MNRVPNIYHFVFGLRPQTEPFHLAYYLCLASCLEVNKPEAIYFHFKHLPYGEWWDRIKPFLILNPVEESDFVKQFSYQNQQIESFRYAHLADIVRLEVLLKYGGVYADIDSLFVNRLPEHLFTKPCVMGKEKVDWGQEAAVRAGGSLCNAWILAEKDSAFIRLWLDQTLKEFDGTWSAHSTFLPYRLSQENVNLIHVEPERSFFFFDWSKKGIRDLFVNKVTDVEGVYSMHLWNHLWWSPSRTDFTYFHHRRLTPEYVAFADTTYARIARKFMPPEVKVSLAAYRKEYLKGQVEKVWLYLKSKF
ncbi:glycosyl transferase [Rufibacter immobilis]|uniref:Glycosyl transferase n=1 Tax=Rufibacter immobilis TaxID=1348778 RepID=A0A3M9MWF9_9BACT|nr:glycosyltransferase [Rufibacter immobilis]RNI29892.1 glycosyl transferase [Rufibacter immobilis]